MGFEGIDRGCEGRVGVKEGEQRAGGEVGVALDGSRDGVEDEFSAAQADEPVVSECDASRACLGLDLAGREGGGGVAWGCVWLPVPGN